MKYFVLALILISATGCTVNSDDLLKAQALGVPVVIHHLSVGAPNYANGMPVNIGFSNASDKPIKYFDFEVEPFNQYGDPQVSEIGNQSLANFRFDSVLVQPNQLVGRELLGYPSWENVWYNRAIYCVKIKKLTVTYIDNETWKGMLLIKANAQKIRGCN
jgi:hypothetical protein